MSRPREGLGEKVAATIRSQHLGSVADMLSDPTCVATGSQISTKIYLKRSDLWTQNRV